MPHGINHEPKSKPDSLLKSLGIAAGVTVGITSILSLTPYADLPSQAEIRSQIAAKEAGEPSYAEQLRKAVNVIVELRGPTQEGYHINPAFAKRKMISEHPSAPAYAPTPEPSPPLPAHPHPTTEHQANPTFTSEKQI